MRIRSYAVYGMRKGLILVLVLASGSLSMADVGGAVQVCLRTPMYCDGPRLVPTIGGSVSPKRLPANEYMPAAWTIFGKVGTTDGTHPSALREVVLDVDKDMRINSRDYPVCKMSGRAIGVLDTKAVAKTCRKALVGRGEALVELAFPEQEPIRLSSRLLVINGGEKAGTTQLLIHLFLPIPHPAAVITKVKIARKGAELHTVTKIPVIAGGSGSLLDFKFTLGKTYSYKGKKVGYFEAKCPDEVFKANVERLLFKNEARAPAVAAQTVMKGALAVPCTPKG